MDRVPAEWNGPQTRSHQSPPPVPSVGPTEVFSSPTPPQLVNRDLSLEESGGRLCSGDQAPLESGTVRPQHGAAPRRALRVTNIHSDPGRCPSDLREPRFFECAERSSTFLPRGTGSEGAEPAPGRVPRRPPSGSAQTGSRRQHAAENCPPHPVCPDARPWGWGARRRVEGAPAPRDLNAS